MSKRCEWCGVFVTRAATPTRWRVAARPINPWSAWNTFRRLLCPECADSATHRAPWWRPMPPYAPWETEFEESAA